MSALAFTLAVALGLAVAIVRGDGSAQIIPLASYCHQINDLCTCEPQSNLVRIHCPAEYAMIMQITDTGTNIAMSYYSAGGVAWLPRFNISQVAKFEFDAYNYWSDTFFRELLDALGVQEVLSVQFRDRSLELEPMGSKSDDETDDLAEMLPTSNVSTWVFSHVPALQYFKYESSQRVLPETIFQAFDSLTTLELRLAVRSLPNGLFSSVTHSLTNLSIVNPHMFHFQPELLHGLQQLRNLSLKLSQPPGVPSRLRRHLFTSMLQLEELRLSRASNYIDPTMFKGSKNLRFISIHKNNELVELPSQLFEDQTNLSLLDLSCNALSKLPVDLFSSQGNLRLLDLANNRLASLSRELFTPLTSLEKLVLNGNSLTALDPATFSEVRSLQFIDMLGTQFYGVKLQMPFEALVCTNEDICQYKSEHWECDPQCLCWVQRYTLMLYVDCRGVDMQQLPPLPQTRLVRTVLKLRNNSISELPDAGDIAGWANVSLLSLADNQLSSVYHRQLPRNLNTLDLRNNQISVLDQNFINYLRKENNTVTLSLAGNPLSCDCGALPLLSFVRAQPQRIPDIGDVFCSVNSDSSKPFQQWEVWELCPSYTLLIGCILGGLVIVACLISVVYLIYQQEVKIWLYNHNLCLWWVSEEELDKDKTYDAFISYSHKDEQLIAELLPKLESGLHAFRVCLHGRDWLVGDCIPEQIVRTVNDSKRVIIVLSQHFIDSVWARMEFRIAYQATLQDKRKRIIIILYKELEHFEGIDSELRAYLRLNTYLKWGDPLFWSKLRYAMPHNRRVLKGQKKHAGPLI
ncbi:hypothetical protein KR222_004527 [Zaprionus bogoriensis]|nr:hypothetical protein KR222_004527 [Zaprionus bogoriensis]